MMNQQLLDKIKSDPTLTEFYANTGRSDLAEFAGLHVTGESKERDTGVTFGKDIAKLSVEELLTLRYELRDTFGDNTGKRVDEDHADGTLEAVVTNLVRILEAEIGGRWV